MSDQTQTGQSVPFSVYEKVLRESQARKAKLRELEAKLTEVSAERDEFADAVNQLGEERDSLDGKLKAAPSELQAKVDQLTTELRTIKHKSVFDKIASEAKVRDDAKGDLWDTLKYTPEADEADEASLKERVTKALESRAYMIQADTQSGNGAAVAAQSISPVAARGAGPGVVRGGAPPVPATDRQVAALQTLATSGRSGDPFKI